MTQRKKQFKRAKENDQSDRNRKVRSSLSLKSLLSNYSIVLMSLGIFASYHFIFSKYYPAANGKLGHDYALTLPQLLAGYFWYVKNGPLSIPWFTPAFCGGVPFLADPQSFYYSVPQLLTTFLDPLMSSYVTSFVFGVVGFYGAYILCRQGFNTSRPSALLAATLFLFNGFFSHRMMIGHLIYHGVMLVPLLAYSLVRKNTALASEAFFSLKQGIYGAMILSYWFYSGMNIFIVPATLSTMVLVLLFNILKKGSRQILMRSAFALILAFGLVASKLTANLAFLSNFSRSEYPLPGLTNIVEAIRVMYLTMIGSASDVTQQVGSVLRNSKWQFTREEFEYGVTIVPFLIFAAAALTLLRSKRTERVKLHGQKVKGYCALLIIILFLPLAINTYSSEWNAFLKTIPFVKSISNPFRWFWIYIPVIVILSGVLLDYIANDEKSRMKLALLSILIIIWANVAENRQYYSEGQEYSPENVINSYRTVRENGSVPSIETIDVVFDASGAAVYSPNYNDTFVFGKSQLLCYDPMFGYSLESFPFKTLQPGPVATVKNGVMNMKNPACYLYASENSCQPGDHFLESEKAQVRLFVDYHPFQFKISRIQVGANLLTQLSLIAIAGLLIFFYFFSKKIRV